MPDRQQTVADELSERVRCHAQRATNCREVAEAVVNALTDARVDLQSVSLEEAKRLFAEALREAHGLRTLSRGPTGR